MADINKMENHVLLSSRSLANSMIEETLSTLVYEAYKLGLSKQMVVEALNKGVSRADNEYAWLVKKEEEGF